jgi:hypothetical protein
VWCFAVAGLLIAELGLGWAGRAAALVLLAWLWRCGRSHLAHPAGPTRLHWDGSGCWRLQYSTGQTHYVRLLAAPKMLGPLIWLAFSTAGRKRQVIIDARYAEPQALSALQCRLRLDARRLEKEVHNG